MNTIDVNPININKQKDSRRQGSSTTFDRAGENGRGFHTLYEEEIAELLAKNSSEIAKNATTNNKTKTKTLNG